MPVFVGRTPLSTSRYLRSLAYVAVAAVAALGQPFVAPAGPLSFFCTSSIGLWNAPAQHDTNPSLGRNGKRE